MHIRWRECPAGSIGLKHVAGRRLTLRPLSCWVSRSCLLHENILRICHLTGKKHICVCLRINDGTLTPTTVPSRVGRVAAATGASNVRIRTGRFAIAPFGVDPNSGFETETPPVRLRELSFLLKTTVSSDPKETFLANFLSDGPALMLLKDSSRFKPLARIALAVETSHMVKSSWNFFGYSSPKCRKRS
jgi:hypothetical protein